MPATERFPVNYVAIALIILSIITLIYLVVVVIYFWNMVNLRPPSRTESTFLFWFGIILGIVFLLAIIFSMVIILTHVSYVTPEITPEITPSIIYPPAVYPAPTTYSTIPYSPPTSTAYPPLTPVYSVMPVSNVSAPRPVSPQTLAMFQ